VIKATAKRIEGLKHEVEVDGHTITVDEPEENGGTDSAPSPSRLLAAALASCTAITIEMYADRKEWDITGFEVEVGYEGTPQTAEPAGFQVELSLPDSLSQEQIGRIRVIAGKCPIHRTLTGKVEIGLEHRTFPASA
jgi:putative redox protein